MENKRIENTADTNANTNVQDVNAIVPDNNPILVPEVSDTNITNSSSSANNANNQPKTQNPTEVKDLIELLDSEETDENISFYLKSVITRLTKTNTVGVESILFELFVTLIKFKKNLRCFENFILSIPENLRNRVINSVSEKRTLVQKALISKNISLVKLLIEYGAEIFVVPTDGNSIVHLAINDAEILQQVLAIIEEMIKRDKIVVPKEIGKVLCYAVYENKLLELKILLNSCFVQFINTITMEILPVHIACGEGNSEALKILIDAGANVFIPAQNDQILPIHIACAKGDVESFKCLINYFLKIIDEKKREGKITFIQDYLTVRTKETQMSPLHFAAFRGNIRVAKYLLMLAPEILNWQSKTGMTALHNAVSESHILCVKLLCINNSNLFIKDKNGNNTIVYAGFKNRFYSGAILMDTINNNLEKISSMGEDILLHKKIFLVLSIIDTTTVIKVSVTKNPNFPSLMNDISRIRNKFNEIGKSVSDRDFSWKKYKLLHLDYNTTEEIKTSLSPTHVKNLASNIDYENIFKNNSGSGVLREYDNMAADVILKSNLFITKDNGRTFEIAYQENYKEHLKNMKLVGYFIALILLSNPVHLPLADYIFKAIASVDLYPEDFIDPDHVQILKIMEKATAEEIAEMRVPFSVSRVILNDSTETNCYKEISLSQNSHLENTNKFVTKENLEEFREKLFNEAYLGGGKQELLKALTDGFHELIPEKFIKIPVIEYSEYSESLSHFNDKQIVELSSNQIIKWTEIKDLITIDLPLDIEIWQKYTRYIGCNMERNEVKWFWNYVKNNSIKKNKDLLKFVTGASNLPIGGFKYLEEEKIPFTLEINEDENLYPYSETCIYALVLTRSRDEETFIGKMDTAIYNCVNFD